MSVGTVSKRYAAALYEYAKEQRAEDAVYENMRQLRDTLLGSKDLLPVLRNPSMGLPEKVEVLCSVIASPSAVFKRFASLVLKASREDILLYIAYAYIGIYRDDKNVVSVKITTAAPLPEALQNRIAAIMETGRSGAKFEIRNIVDESLTGGFVCEAKGLRFDASVKKQLAEIRKKLVKTSRNLV